MTEQNEGVDEGIGTLGKGGILRDGGQEDLRHAGGEYGMLSGLSKGAEVIVKRPFRTEMGDLASDGGE